MAFTTLQQVKDGRRKDRALFINKASQNVTQADKWFDNWSLGNWPVAGSFSGSLAGAVLDKSVTGALPFDNPPSGEIRIIRADPQSVGANGLTAIVMQLLIDRLWHNGGIDTTSTGVQTINSVTFPARDDDASVNGKGVYIALVFQQAQTGGVAPVATLSYTNSAGVSGRTATVISPIVANENALQLHLFELQAGDLGVKSIQSIQFSASFGSATAMGLLAFRPLCLLSADSGLHNARDAISLGFPQVFPDSCLGLIRPSSATAGIQVDLTMAWE